MLKWLILLFRKIRMRLGGGKIGLFQGHGRLESFDPSSGSATVSVQPRDAVGPGPGPAAASVAKSNKQKWGRDKLPHPQTDYRLSIWAILKNCCGKEFYRFSMPVEMNEPLSFLQRLTETLEYSDLLEVAGVERNDIRRMQYVAAFVVSSLSSNLDRMKKPFNPILGETYELNRGQEESCCFRVVCEQVSHHPPVSAMWAASGRGTYDLECSVCPQLYFWGRYIEIRPQGSSTLRFLKRDDEEYVWSCVECRIHNLFIGELYLEQIGEQVIRCDRTGLSCHIRYLSKKSADDMHMIEGEIIDTHGSKIVELTGKWTKEIFFSDRPDTPVWKVHKRPRYSNKYFNFTYMAMSLNEMPQGARWKRGPNGREAPSIDPLDPSNLAPTDSRFRKDIRMLERGDIEGAADEKLRLEEKQRDVRQVRVDCGAEWTPLWFDKIDDTIWKYSGEYWKRKSNADLPDLF